MDFWLCTHWAYLAQARTVLSFDQAYSLRGCANSVNLVPIRALCCSRSLPRRCGPSPSPCCVLVLVLHLHFQALQHHNRLAWVCVCLHVWLLELSSMLLSVALKAQNSDSKCSSDMNVATVSPGCLNLLWNCLQRQRSVVLHQNFYKLIKWLSGQFHRHKSPQPFHIAGPTMVKNMACFSSDSTPF